jgi:WD40 repeat protein
MKRSLLLSLALLIACYTSSFAELSDTIWTHPLLGNVINVKFSPDGKYIYEANQTKVISKIDAVTNKIVTEYNTPFGVYNMDLSQDGNYILACGDTTLFLIDTKTKEIIHNFQLPPVPQGEPSYSSKGIESVSISYDNKYCGITLIGTKTTVPKDMSTSSIICCELETGKLALNLVENSFIARYFKFSPTENIFAVGYHLGDKNHIVPIELYEVGTWKLLKSFAGHTYQMKGFKFSKDGNSLASWSDGDEKIKIWDIKTLTLKPNTNGKYQIASMWDLCFLNDSTIIASAEVLLNSQLRWQFILMDLNKQTKTVIADGGGGIDLSILNSLNLLVTANYTGITLYNLDKTLDVQSDIQPPPIILYPNPVTKELTVSISETNNVLVNYRIINSVGIEVIKNSLPVQNNVLKINVSNLINGSYLLNLQLNNTQHSIKFVKE